MSYLGFNKQAIRTVAWAALCPRPPAPMSARIAAPVAARECVRGEVTCVAKCAVALSLVLASALWARPASALPVPASVPAHPAKAPDAASSSQAKPDPDVALIELYKDLAANNLREAQQKADALVQAYPNFRLGHLIRGDLLLMHGRPVSAFGAGSNASPDKLKDLREEAIVRLKSLRSRPDPELIPRSVLQMRQDQKHVLVVDAKQSRLYVYRNTDGRPKFVTDYYITQGKLGINKIKQGDQKTPVGVYYITGLLPKAKLPDFYGAGALPINYPNEWDKLNGRSGSGIWLHGTPSTMYSRAPLASDGCVVLTNDDMEKLFGSVEIGLTPVIIAEQAEFVSKNRWEAERSAASKMTESWRRDVETLNPTKLLANYSHRFKSGLGEDLNVWFGKMRQSLAGQTSLSVTLKDHSTFRYPGNEDMIVSTFTQENWNGKAKSTLRKRQYWRKENAQWKIIYETNL